MPQTAGITEDRPNSADAKADQQANKNKVII